MGQIFHSNLQAVKPICSLIAQTLILWKICIIHREALFCVIFAVKCGRALSRASKSLTQKLANENSTLHQRARPLSVNETSATFISRTRQTGNTLLRAMAMKTDDDIKATSNFVLTCTRNHANVAIVAVAHSRRYSPLSELCKVRCV